MIEIALVVLKFAALIIGGIFAALGLLTDYRDKKGAVTPWGKIALFGIVLSTIVAAGTQAIESYRDRTTALANDAANRQSELATQNLLAEIKRAIHPLESLALSDLIITYPADMPPISTFVQGIPTPPYTLFTLTSTRYHADLELRKLLEPRIYVRYWIKGADASKKDPDLGFDLSVNDVLLVRQSDQLTVRVRHHSIPKTLIRRSPAIASLQDMAGGEIRLDFAEKPVPPAHLALFQKSNARLTLEINQFHIDADLLPIEGTSVLMGVTSPPY